jgi:hypothetical protein
MSRPLLGDLISLSRMDLPFANGLGMFEKAGIGRMPNEFYVSVHRDSLK